MLLNAKNQRISTIKLQQAVAITMYRIAENFRWGFYFRDFRSLYTGSRKIKTRKKNPVKINSVMI